MPKVTIILTSYNHAKYLSEAIESVLNQTFTDYELIIGDDASTDDSWDIIQGYSDPRVIAYRHATNQLGGIINELLEAEKVSGEYVAIQHSDDIWEPQKLEKQVAFLDAHPEVGAVFTNVLMINEQGESFLDETKSNQTVFDQPNRDRYTWLNYFFTTGNALCHPSVLLRRTCYEECGVYRYGLSQLGDFDLWIRLCLKYEIYILPEKLLKLRIHSNDSNASANRPDTRIRRQFDTLKILDNYRNIQTFDELLQIFPSSTKYARIENADVHFILGMIALETETLYGNVTRLFGLNLIFEALNDHERASKIAELYRFTQKEFFSLSSKYDIFAVELLAKLGALEMQLNEKEHKILTLSGEKDTLNRLLLEIQNSRAWKFVTKYREIQAGILAMVNFRIK